MKKVLLIAAGAIVLGAVVAAGICLNRERIEKEIFTMKNVAALSSSETEVEGFCAEESGECIAVCQNCHTLYYAGGHSGGSYNMSGKCAICKEENW